MLNDLIRHIDKTECPLQTTYYVIGCLACQDYDGNRDLINGLLFYAYDLMGM